MSERAGALVPSFPRVRRACRWCGRSFCHVAAPGPAQAPVLCPTCRAQARRRRRELADQLAERAYWIGQEEP